MTVQQKISAFFSKQGFEVNGHNINTVIDAILYDMEAGLAYPRTFAMEASQPMIPTWTAPPSQAPKNTSVVVIDAGGTNFRSCLVSFDEKGMPSITKLEKCSMPGSERELGKKEFFDTIASFLDHVKNDSTRIGFCFSYAMEITPEGDGKVLSFSKEIKAKEVIGSFVGASLADALVQRGWKRPEKIVLLNDTTAALLAGAVNAVEGRQFSSYIGLILGTGMNAAYIEQNPIEKIADAVAKGAQAPKEHIIVCESGNIDKVQRSSFDVEFDKTTNTPGKYMYEKMCSGAYLGPIAKVTLKKAASEGLFSPAVAKAIETVQSVELKDMDQFFYGPYRTNTVLGSIASLGTQEDYDTIYLLLDALVDRSARLTAANIAAAVIKSGKGNNPSLPVCIVCEGTTFYKTHNLQDRLKGYLNAVLTEQRHLYFEIVTMDNAITLGAAVAGLSGK